MDEFIKDLLNDSKKERLNLNTKNLMDAAAEMLALAEKMERRGVEPAYIIGGMVHAAAFIWIQVRKPGIGMETFNKFMIHLTNWTEKHAGN